MKLLSQTGLSELISKIKAWGAATFLDKTDVEQTTTIGVDSTPTSGSTNLVTSGGVKTALDGKQDAIPTITIDASQIVSMDPARAILTEEQFSIFSNASIPSVVVSIPATEIEMTLNAYSSNRRTAIFTSAGGLTVWTVSRYGGLDDYEVQLNRDECAFSIYEDGSLVKFYYDQLYAAVPDEDYATPGTLTINGTTYNLRTSTTDAGQAGYITFVTEE